MLPIMDVNQFIDIAAKVLELCLVALEATMQSRAFAGRGHARDHFKALAYEVGARVVCIETRIERAEFLGCLAEI